MRKILAALALALLLVPGAAPAQSPPSTRVRGIISEINGADLTVKQADGVSLAVHLADNYPVAAIAKATAADIKPGNFIGAGARPQPDGTLAAVQIVIFPEAMRGTGEGHRAWGVMPEATMTNATVAETVSGVSGPLLTLKYKDGEQKLTIPADANILALVPAEKSDVVAGAEVQLFAVKAADGTLQASRVTLIRAGANPM